MQLCCVLIYRVLVLYKLLVTPKTKGNYKSFYPFIFLFCYTSNIEERGTYAEPDYVVSYLDIFAFVGPK